MDHGGGKKGNSSSTSQVQGKPSIRHLISSRAGTRISAEQNLMFLSIPSIPGICIPVDQPQILHLSLLRSDTTITASFPSAASLTIPLVEGKVCKKKKREKNCICFIRRGKQTFSYRVLESEDALSSTDGQPQSRTSV